jgi:hypothetical protein
MAKATVIPSIPDDPIYLAIEQHRNAALEFSQALKPLARNNGDPDPKKEKKYGDRENEAIDRLTATAPTTLKGLLALVSYVNGVAGGKFSSGRRDNTFDEPESLYGVLASAEKILSEQIGRSA